MKKISNFIVFLSFLLFFHVNELASLNSNDLCLLPKNCSDPAQYKSSDDCDRKCHGAYTYHCGKHFCSLKKDTCSEFYYLSFLFRMKNIQVNDRRINEFESLISKIKLCEGNTLAKKKYDNLI